MKQHASKKARRKAGGNNGQSEAPIITPEMGQQIADSITEKAPEQPTAAAGFLESSPAKDAERPRSFERVDLLAMELAQTKVELALATAGVVAESMKREEAERQRNDVQGLLALLKLKNHHDVLGSRLREAQNQWETIRSGIEDRYGVSMRALIYNDETGIITYNDEIVAGETDG